MAAWQYWCRGKRVRMEKKNRKKSDKNEALMCCVVHYYNRMWCMATAVVRASNEFRSGGQLVRYSPTCVVIFERPRAHIT